MGSWEGGSVCLEGKRGECVWRVEFVSQCERKGVLGFFRAKRMILLEWKDSEREQRKGECEAEGESKGQCVCVCVCVCGGGSMQHGSMQP
jgi:hypothetical protein